MISLSTVVWKVTCLTCISIMLIIIKCLKSNYSEWDCRRRVCPRTVVPSSTLSSKFTQCRHRQHIQPSVSYYLILSWHLIYYIDMQRKYLCASWSFLQWAVTPRTQPPLLGPRSYSRPVDTYQGTDGTSCQGGRRTWIVQEREGEKPQDVSEATRPKPSATHKS